MPKKINAALCVFLACMALQPTIALSCAPPVNGYDPLKEASLAKDQYTVGYGTFSGGPIIFAENREREVATTYFSGVFFVDGNTISADQKPVTVEASTLKRWGRDPFTLEKNQNYLVVFDTSGTGELYLLSEPCVDPYVVNIERLDTARVAKCIADANCTDADLGR